MKSGYQITSENEAAVTYIKQRIRAMEFGTSTPFDVLLNGIGYDLVTYSNAFLVKSRVDKIANGIQAKGVLDKKPVGGYFRMNPTTVTIKRASDGTINGYQQEVGNTTKTYNTNDVIHFYIDKEAGNAFGTPRMSSALEDVKILRKVEGNTLALLYRFALPLYHMKIGLPQENFMATNQQLQEAKTQVEKMPMDGIIITDQSTSFYKVGAEGAAIDMVPYLEYYEKRVFSALNVSESMMGRGGAKQDADSMEQQIHDQVKFYQHMMEVFIENCIFNELLLEGGYNPIFNEEDRVNFVFNEISLDTKIKLENHVMTQFQGNMITFDEARRKIGLTSQNTDTSQLYANMITQTNAKELLNIKLGASDTANNDGRTTNGKENSDTTPNKDASTKNQPTNQHGTFSAKVHESANLTENTNDRIDEYRKNYGTIYKKYNTLRNQIGEIHKKEYDEIWNSIEKSIKNYVKNDAGHGSLMVYISLNKNPENTIIDLTELDKSVTESVNKIKTVIWSRIKEKKNPEYRRIVLNTMAYRLRFLCKYQIQKAYWYGFVKTANKLGIEYVTVQFHSDDDKKNHKEKVKTSDFSLDDIPPYKAYCKCTLGIGG